MSDEKYILFSAIGFNDPAGFELNPNYIENKINEYFTNKIIAEKYDKEAILSNFSNYKNKKIYSEGSMLSIVRKFKPERVMLFFTKDMYERKDNNGNSIIDILKDEILKRSKKCSCKNILIKTSNMIANSFDDDLVSDNGQNFTEMIEQLKEGYEDYQILINITSGTNQIKTKLILESIYGKENNIKAVYITPPNIRESVNDDDSYYEDDDYNYDYTEVIDPDYKKEYKKDEDNKEIFYEYEQLRLEMKDTKYDYPDFKIFVALKIKNQISALLEKSYEYKACYELFKDDYFIVNNFPSILNLLKYADLRSNLKYTDDELKNNGIDISDECLEYFQNKLNFIKKDSESFLELIENDTNKKIVLTEDCINELVFLIKKDSKKLLLLIEYFYIMKLKQQKGDLSDFVLRLEPFLKYILDNFNSYTRYSIYNKLTNIKNKLRHTIAHQMVNVSEDNIKEKSEKSSEYIINKCGELLELICGGNFDKEYFVYDEINKKIYDEIDKISKKK